MNRIALVLLGCVAAGCGSKTIAECNSDADCGIVYPFCDVNGEFAPSGGAKNVCTIIPPDCSVERCGCSPGATTCTGDEATTCNLDGKSTTTDTCALGCATTQDRCLAFKPLNGLAPAMTAALAEPDVVITAGSTIDTDTGLVRNSANAKINVSSLVVTGPVDVRVFLGGSFDIDDVIVTGTKAVAFVSPRTVMIRGMIDASANKNVSGPGASATGCVGQSATDTGTSITVAGGGGHATSGGSGRAVKSFTQGGAVLVQASGGVASPGSALIGGCLGGGGANGGGGGGAVQIDSLTKIEFTSTPKLGFIHVGGGGAIQASSLSSGGGAGGLVVLEAPEVDLGGVAANGGSGATCGIDGNDATATLAVAAGVGSPCSSIAPPGGSGAGGTIDHPPTDGGGVPGGGGGGAVGVMFVNTIDGTYTSIAGSIVSAYVTPGTLVPN